MQCKTVGCLNHVTTFGVWGYCSKCTNHMAQRTKAPRCSNTHCVDFNSNAESLSPKCHEYLDRLEQKMVGGVLPKQPITPSRRSNDKPQKDTSSGGDNDYWIIKITHPKRLKPCEVECEDLIAALELDFFEGEAFKAIFRKAKARLGDGKPGDTAIRNAEKVHHMGGRMIANEKRRLAKLEVIK